MLGAGSTPDRVMNAPAPATAVAPQLVGFDLIRQLVAYDTTSRESNLALIDWVRDYLAGQGITSQLTYDDERRKANLFATLPAQDGNTTARRHRAIRAYRRGARRRPTLGHAPFAATLVGDRLYGRGVTDMKSFSAIGLALVPELLRRGLSRPLHFALSYDEEVGCIGVRRLIADVVARGIKPAGCIVGEPTGMQVVVAHKGKRAYRCRVRGHEAHSSLTPLGVNAVQVASELVTFLTQMARAFPRPRRLRRLLRCALHDGACRSDPRRHRAQHRAARLPVRLRNSAICRSTIPTPCSPR